MRLDPSEIRNLILLIDGNDIYILKNAEAARAWLEPDIQRNAEGIVFSGDGRKGTLWIGTERCGTFFRGKREVVEFDFPSAPTQESLEEFASILNGIFRALDVPHSARAEYIDDAVRVACDYYGVRES